MILQIEFYSHKRLKVSWKITIDLVKLAGAGLDLGSVAQTPSISVSAYIDGNLHSVVLEYHRDLSEHPNEICL